MTFSSKNGANRSERPDFTGFINRRRNEALTLVYKEYK